MCRANKSVMQITNQASNEKRPQKKKDQRKIFFCENCVLYVNIEFARNQSNSVAFHD